MIALLEPLPPELLVEEPEYGVNLLSAYLQVYRTAEGRALADRLAPRMSVHANDRLHRRFLTMQAMLFNREGRVAMAEEQLREAEWMATLAGDDYMLAWTTERSAIVATIRCDFETALRLHHRALAFSTRGAESHQIGSLHQNLGETYREMGLYAHARRHHDRALREQLLAPELAIMSFHRACLHQDLGELDLAEVFARRAEEQGRALGSGALVAGSLRVRGTLAALRGRRDAAMELLRQALEDARGEEVMRGTIYEDMALAHVMFGEPVEALAAESVAAEIYTRLDAPRRAERMRLRLAVIALERDA
ncbi:MAG: tetratricopeptide repeat protein [Gemmatimonadetes bacterium]|nr:tetratricopeptide repeat protein [Gemmatimonadota bacterium]